MSDGNVLWSLGVSEKASDKIISVCNVEPLDNTKDFDNQKFLSRSSVAVTVAPGRAVARLHLHRVCFLG